MSIIYNEASRFFREVREIEIFNCDDLTYAGIYYHFVPSAIPTVVFKNINPEDFVRSIQRKFRKGSYYFSVDISFGIYDMKLSDYEKYNSRLNAKNFMIVLKTNEDFMVIGSKYETLRVDVLDRKKEDNSGTDKYEIQITGETIVEPSFYSY